LLLGVAVAAGAEPPGFEKPAVPHPLDESVRARLKADHELRLAALTKAIEAEPEKVALYSQRGDARLFLGRFREAVADFEKMIALDPAQDAPHWRLGIAYHFAGEFRKSSRQFEKYHAYDGRDRENGIWKFLADAKTDGIDAARTKMLEYKEFDREPFPALYEMFAGRKSTAAMLDDVRGKGLAEKGSVAFFANYYGGLNEDLEGRRSRALELIARAVASPWGRTAEGGPAYMWQVARLHYEQLATAQKATPP
jgi:lipoprotein NlpI